MQESKNDAGQARPAVASFLLVSALAALAGRARRTKYRMIC
jgi:hypothetical protein